MRVGLVEEADLTELSLLPEQQVDHAGIARCKGEALQKAWERYKTKCRVGALHVDISAWPAMFSTFLADEAS